MPVPGDTAEEARANSPGSYSPWNEDTLGIGTATHAPPQAVHETQGTQAPLQSPVANGGGRMRRRSFLNVRRPSSKVVTGNSPTFANIALAAPNNEEVLSGEKGMGDKFSDNNGYTQLQSPEKTRNGQTHSTATGQQQPPPRLGVFGRKHSAQASYSSDKALPAPPPPEPVMPRFDDYDASQPSSPSSGSHGGSVQRKPSILKKVKDRIGR